MKYECSINGPDKPKGEPELVVDCAGNVIEGGAGEAYSRRCSVGNLEDFINENRSLILEDISNPANLPLKPLRLNVVVPIYNSGTSILNTVKSILNSRVSEKYEILFYLNESSTSPDSVCKNNDLSFQVLQNIFFDSGEIATEVKEEVLELKSLYDKNKDNLNISIVRNQVTHGLTEVYQSSIASYLGRLWSYAESLSDEGKEKDEVVKEIDEVEHNSVILFLDDDIILKEDTLSNIYNACLHKNKMSVGRLNIIDVVTPNEELKQALKVIMTCWIEFKEAFSLNVFSPRGALMTDLHHNHPINPEEDYADQKIFAQLRGKGRGLYHTEVDTVIGESDIPSNGYFMKRIRLYLEGEIKDFSELLCIQNVLNIYRARRCNNSYTLEEVEDFFAAVENRDISKVLSQGQELLKKKIVY